MAKNKISLPVIHRLPRYYRYIVELNARGIKHVSSGQLAEIMGTTASQVRWDFNCFGGFGQQGIGYSTQLLKDELEKLLFNSEKRNAVLVGVGNLGVAMTNFITYENLGIDLVALFDVNKTIIGNTVAGVTIRDVKELGKYCSENKVDMMVMCVPKEAAEELLPVIKNSGVRGIWNFSHFDFSLYDSNLICENIHLRDSALSLVYRLTNSDVE
jgi:redox-sensing transcriptional repressor